MYIYIYIYTYVNLKEGNPNRNEIVVNCEWVKHAYQVVDGWDPPLGRCAINSATGKRPISLLTLSLLRSLDSSFPRFPMGLGIPPLRIKLMPESNPLKSTMLVRRLAEGPPPRALPGAPRGYDYYYYYCYYF